MFDIGFWEIILILVIMLLVVGPERLPRLARTAGLWLGKARGFVSSVKADIDRELAAEELKRHLMKQAESTGIHEIIEETKAVAKDLEEPQERKPDYLVKSMPDKQSEDIAKPASGGSRAEAPADTHDRIE